MKTLNTIQKTCKVFKILSKVAMIISFVWAGCSAVGLLCGIAWAGGGTVAGVSFENALELSQVGNLNQMIGVMIADFVFALTDALLFMFAMGYFRRELADGTPFTESGANALKNLGIKIIVMPLVAVCIAAVVYTIFGVSRPDEFGGVSVIMGIALILFSIVLRYGAELEKGKKAEVEIQ